MKQEHYTEICEVIIETIKSQYPVAKDALIELESKERIKALAAFTDLRDVFDHFYLAIEYASNTIIEDENKAQIIRDQLNSAKEHFRRAAVEPMETSIEDLISKIIKKAKYNYFLRFIRLSKVSNEEITKNLQDARTTISAIRKKKGQLNQLESTIKTLQELNDRLRAFEIRLPTAITLQLIMSMIATFLLGIFIGILF